MVDRESHQAVVGPQIGVSDDPDLSASVVC